MPSSRRFLPLVGFVLLLFRPAAATTVNDLCPGQPLPDPCVLRFKTVVVDAGTTVLDFGTREFRIARSGRLRLPAGSALTIEARSIVLEAGALIDHAAGAIARGAEVTLTATQDVQLLRNGLSRARIDLSADESAGGAHLNAGRNAVVSGDIRVEGTAAGGGDGSIEIAAAADATIDGELNIQGSSGGNGGDLNVSAPTGRVIMTGDVKAGGAEGGTIDISGGSLISSSGNLDTAGNGLPSDGGQVGITATGDIMLAGNIKTFARGGFSGDSGDGGDVSINADGTLIMGAEITSSGGGEDGQGAEIDLEAGDLLRVEAAIDVQARSNGGSVSITADEVVVAAQINADGTDGGEVNVSTRHAGKSTVAGPVTITSNVHASGAQGNITLEGCDVNVPAGARLTCDGAPAGENSIFASGQMTIAGRLSARADGRNSLQYRDPARPPITTGADINPAATQTEMATLRPCAGPPVCGNGERERGEGCDDGNTIACQALTHCSATCQVEVCGNGTPECGEQCDDGNTVDGDTCDSNCTTPRCGNGITAGTEECDDGNTADDDGCDSTCHIESPPGCGDGQTIPPEQCDDGADDVPCDGCFQCVLETCGNHVEECMEECDDGNTDSCDGCSPTCKIEHLCGNGVQECDETCDKGADNGQPGSGCDTSCHICDPGSSAECPCASHHDCNTGGICAGFMCESGLCISSAPLACADDGNVCNGVQTCDPAVGCVAGAPPACDDNDACTDDACDPVRSCPHPLMPGFSGLTCRVDGLDGVVKGAGAGDISRSIQKKLKKLVAKVRAGARKAEKAKKARKATKLLAGARKQAVKIGTVVTAALGTNKVEPGLAAELSDKAAKATAAIDVVSGSLSTPQ